MSVQYKIFLNYSLYYYKSIKLLKQILARGSYEVLFLISVLLTEKVLRLEPKPKPLIPLC